MEMDFMYKQYAQNFGINNDEQKPKQNVEHKQYRPNEELIEYFEKNKTNFSYNDFQKLLRNISGDLTLNLADSTEVIISKTEGMVKLLIKYPNNTAFFGCYANTQDADEIFKHMK